MAHLFPSELDLSAITVQVEQLAQLLSDVAAERHVTLFCTHFQISYDIFIYFQIRTDAAHHARESAAQDGARDQRTDGATAADASPTRRRAHFGPAVLHRPDDGPGTHDDGGTGLCMAGRERHL